MSTHRRADVKAAQDKKRKHRSHKNTPRLTAKERAQAVAEAYWNGHASVPASALPLAIERALQAHARDAVARYKLRHCCDCDIRNAAR